MLEYEMLLTKCGETQIIYFPFYRMAFKANSEAINLFQDFFKYKKDIKLGEQNSSQFKEILAQFSLRKPYVFSERPNKISNYQSLVILPNYKCNFSCSYCYSAIGRSNKEISLENLKIALDHFIYNVKQKSLKQIKVSFLGGGEPFLSWNCIIWTYEYLHKNLSDNNVAIQFSITTNGSLLKTDYLQWISQHKIHVNISFEILSDIQNKQRGQFDKVSYNVKMMLKSGINLSIRSTITENNVLRMEEMVQEILTHYPTIKKLHFEPVTDKLESSDYYSNFIKYYFRARRIANKNNVKLICSIVKSFSSLRKRFCGGEQCLTPDGFYTICHRCSSPLEKIYKSFIYGNIINEKVRIDNEKLASILKKDVFEYNECSKCIAKWHCAGGCLFQRMTYNPSQMQIACNFTKKIISLLLLERIDIKEFDKIIDSDQIINL